MLQLAVAVGSGSYPQSKIHNPKSEAAVGSGLICNLKSTIRSGRRQQQLAAKTLIESGIILNADNTDLNGFLALSVEICEICGKKKDSRSGSWQWQLAAAVIRNLKSTIRNQKLQ